jgi:hypothetical protein
VGQELIVQNREWAGLRGETKMAHLSGRLSQVIGEGLWASGLRAEFSDDVETDTFGIFATSL